MEASKPRRDLYAEVTQRIVQALAQGVRPWACPWRKDAETPARPRRHNGETYRGINVLLLWATAQERGYQRNTWLTYRQAEALGGQVRKGERGALVVFAGRQSTSDAAEEVEEPSEPRSQRTFAFLRSYTVFNIDQVDGLPEADSVPTVSLAQVRPDEGAEAFFAATGARVQHGGSRAFYAPGSDLIQLPDPSAFRDPASYAATKAHELAHWTGHPQRLAREFGRRFGDAAYAMEELVAELCAAFICADLRIGAEPREDHAAYVGDWLKVLQSDSRAVFTAASQAQRAADFLHAFQGAPRV
ncbi:ArdC family protein [Tepidimonas sp.]|uniref:ArdC family protein n=1 Tax=Tepidimonas sp. TaxID=2002775 RepID=UPI002FE25603